MPPLPSDVVRLRLWKFGRWTSIGVIASLLIGVPLLVAIGAIRYGAITNEVATVMWRGIAVSTLIYFVVALSWVTVDERGIAVVTCGLARRRRWAEVTSVGIRVRPRRVQGASSVIWWRVHDQVALAVVVGGRTVMPFATRRARVRPIPGVDTGHDDVEDLYLLVELARRHLSTGDRT